MYIIYIYTYIALHYITLHCIAIHDITLHIYIYIFEGSLEVKLPTIRTDGEAKVGRVREEKRREEERRSEKRKSQKKEDAGVRKGGKVAIHCVFSKDLWLRRVKK